MFDNHFKFASEGEGAQEAQADFEKHTVQELIQNGGQHENNFDEAHEWWRGLSQEIHKPLTEAQTLSMEQRLCKFAEEKK